MSILLVKKIRVYFDKNHISSAAISDKIKKLKNKNNIFVVPVVLLICQLILKKNNSYLHFAKTVQFCVGID